MTKLKHSHGVCDIRQCTNCPACRELWRRCVKLLRNDPHREVSYNYARMHTMPDWFEYPDWSHRKCSELATRLERWLNETEGK